MEQQLLIASLIQEKVDSQVKISPEQISLYYKENKHDSTDWRGEPSVLDTLY